MRAQTALPRIVGKSLPEKIHQKRRQTLLSIVSAAVSAESLAVTSIGRALCHANASTSAKHAIKRADRLLSNQLLRDEMNEIYAGIARTLVAGVARPVILVDWTELDRRRVHALVASVSCDGRSLVVCVHVVDQAMAGSRAAEKAFLAQLAAILPVGCRPIIVTDAGFKTLWCDRIRKLGWDFVARVRGATRFKQSKADWQAVRSLHRGASCVRDLGVVSITQSKERHVRLVVSARHKQNRRSLTSRGKKRRSTQALHQRKAQREPWVLSTSITDCSADRIVQIYAQRMRIEETFRDTKTARFGLGLELARGRPDRIAVLFLIAALASLALLWIGSCAEHFRRHRSFQANTVRNKRVLSLVRLGLEMWRVDADLPWKRFALTLPNEAHLR